MNGFTVDKFAFDFAENADTTIDVDNTNKISKTDSVAVRLYKGFDKESVIEIKANLNCSGILNVLDKSITIDDFTTSGV